MAGIQIDGVNNKIDFDDDADTSISSATDDTLVIESGGVNVASITAGEFAINEGSADIDFRVESDGATHQLFVDAGNGRVGVGTSSPDYTLHVRSTGSPSNDTFIDIEGNATDANCGIQFTDSAGNLQGRISYDTDDDNLQFMVNTSTERMRIGSNGNISVGNTATDAAFGVTVADTRITSGICLDVHHTKSDTTFSGVVGRFQSARNTTNTTYKMISCAISGVAEKFVVTDGGTIQAVNTTVASTSDERIKQDIVDANSQWNDIKALKFKNFKKKQAVRDDGENALKELGVIAQDVEAAGMNGLIELTDPDISHIKSDSAFGTLWTDDDDEVKNGTETAGEVKEIKEKVKTVKYSMIWMKAVKALQEAQLRIEELETKVAALEGN